MKHFLFPYIIFYVCIFLFYHFNLANFILNIAFVPYHSPNSSYLLNCDVPVPKATVCYFATVSLPDEERQCLSKYWIK